MGRVERETGKGKGLLVGMSFRGVGKVLKVHSGDDCTTP